MAITLQDLLKDSPEIIGDVPAIIAAINAYEALAVRKPSDTITLVTTILNLLAPLVDELVAQSKTIAKPI